MKKLLLTMLTIAACGPRPYFQWDLGMHPRAVLADGSTDARWTKMVDDARTEWSVPLAEMGCDDPFRGEDTNPVELVPDAQWTRPDAIGDTRSWGITVKGTMDELEVNMSYTTILPHELGHALGLVHVGVDVDPDSIMHPTVDRTTPDMRDLENAARAIGCIQ